ncbi:MAG: ATP-binding protein [Alphaproteobacteria bacterium]|nr:MAG: ATP-binding protein [Alphaproteobacteria bacterium]
MTGVDASAARARSARESCAFNLPPTFEGVRAAVSEAARIASAGALPCDLVEDLKLVLSEALNNVVEHAYAGDAPDGEAIAIAMELGERGLTLTIRDRGRPMPDGLPKPELPSIPAQTEALPEGGFGWSLIHLICTDVTYRRDGDENVLRLSLGPR